MGGNETDRLALLAIKAQIKQDPHNVTSSWNESIHFCFWHGVSCGRRHRQRVTRLDLQSQKLAGSLPQHIGNLSFLRELELQNNSFSHEIPPEIGNLRRLQGRSLLPWGKPFVSRGKNQIQGSLPSDLGKTLPNLQVLNIAGNKFFGSLPPSLSNATSLQQFQFQDNKLTGQVPDFRKLHDLEIFNIQRNHLGSGTDGDLSFVSDLTNATELNQLMLSENNFGGTLPTSISNLSTKLEMFWFFRNQLHGSIPTELGNLVNLKSLVMWGNSLTGNIPTEIQKLSSLVELDISMNALSGSIPSSLGNLTKLYNLFLEGNNLEGVIPFKLGELPAADIIGFI
ncbi:putative LRR receptor-like serine/threonine-protein kinase [Prunus yedoensis var. nudiflora]|uniref:Putative LRR receptor-like serine/threonine-protein kinase n=1 Tax=Prunus yedoensis var. nudiflora TaxID=2094558 RepID=A0A314Z586_PRUYE|nr:putative LRR receptor-like serine/threonine-protein kinase [Prunus yedoensis var. nudiflora]